MKKLTILLVYVFLPFLLYAQKPMNIPIEYPVVQLPTHTEYSNYQTYDLYVVANQDKIDKVLGGRYPVALYGLEQDTANGDFKIMVKIISFSITKASVSGDTAIMRASVNAKPFVYDKDGKQIYGQSIQCNTEARKKGIKSREAFDASANELMRTAFSKALPILLSEFQKEYTNTLEFKRSYLIEIFGWKKIEGGSAINDSIAAIIASTPNPNQYKQTVDRQIDFWDKYTDGSDGNQSPFLQGIASFNLMQLYLFQGDGEKAKIYAAKANASELASSYKKQIAKRLERIEVAATTSLSNIHPDKSASKITMHQLITKTRYFDFSGKAILKDGTTVEGSGLINRKDMNASESPGIISLDKTDYQVEITSNNNITKCKLSEIQSIETTESTYLMKSGNLLQSVYQNDKITLFKPVFPEESEFCYFKKHEGELENTPLVGSGKWLKKYFADCPELIKKIDSKDLKDNFEIGRYYGENCK